jgi:hypothetical protein
MLVAHGHKKGTGELLSLDQLVGFSCVKQVSLARLILTTFGFTDNPIATETTLSSSRPTECCLKPERSPEISVVFKGFNSIFARVQ